MIQFIKEVFKDYIYLMRNYYISLLSCILILAASVGLLIVAPAFLLPTALFVVFQLLVITNRIDRGLYD